MSAPTDRHPDDQGVDDLLAACGARLSEIDPQQAMRLDPIGWHTAQRLWAQAQGAVGQVRAALLARVWHHLAPLAHGGSAAQADRMTPPADPAAGDTAQPPWGLHVPPPGTPLSSLEPMRHIHARLKIRQQVRHTLAQPLRHAGPLHSERLVQQSLARLNQGSEAYLQRFMPYLEALAALEDAQSLARMAGAVVKPRAKVKAGSTTKR